MPFAVTINEQLRSVIAAGRRVSLSESDGPINGERAQNAESCATVRYGQQHRLSEQICRLFGCWRASPEVLY